MPFESGSTALMVCRLNESMPGDFLERLAKYTAGKLDDVEKGSSGNDCREYP